MKKLLVLGILVLFVSAVFTLESDPSEVVGYVKYDLEKFAGKDITLRWSINPPEVDNNGVLGIVAAPGLINKIVKQVEKIPKTSDPYILAM